MRGLKRAVNGSQAVESGPGAGEVVESRGKKRACGRGRHEVGEVDDGQAVPVSSAFKTDGLSPAL